MSQLRSLLLFAFVLPLAFVIGESARDTLFEQTTSKIFVFQSTQLQEGEIAQNLPTGWGRLPFDGAFQVVERRAARSLSLPHFLILTQTQGAWTLQLPDKGSVGDNAVFKRIDQIVGLKVDLTTRAVFHPTVDDVFAAASSSGLFRCSLNGLPVERKHAQGNILIKEDDSRLAAERCRFVPYDFGSVTAIEFANPAGEDLWVGSEKGLFYVNQHDSILYVNSTEGLGVVSLAVDYSNKAVWAGTQHKLWRFNGELWSFFWVPAVVDMAPVSLTLDNDLNLWVPNEQSITTIAPDLTAVRLRGADGVPVVNFTSSGVAGRSGAIWLGSKFGVVRYLKVDAKSQDPNWRYFYGPRWLPGKSFSQGQSVVSLAVVDFTTDETAVVVTDGGIAIVRQESGWTLKRKADYYQSMVEPRHDRLGYVCDCNLDVFGDLSSWKSHYDENSGLWTSMYVASQAFRYKVTKDPTVKSKAWKNFEAMEFLYNVTGIPGLMARTVAPRGPLPNKNWHYSSSYPGWMWEGDTSSDEVVGHMFVYPLVYELLAETPGEKQRALRLINDTMNYIVDNGLYLIDVTGKPTRWGNWAPEYLNHNLTWTDQNGLNSLQILSWLLSAYRLTGEAKFINEVRRLVDKHQYGINIVNTKDVHPGDDDYSDDELAYLAFFTWQWAWNATPSDLASAFRRGFDRYFSIIKPVRSSLWNIINLSFPERTAAQKEEDGDLMDAAVWTLRRWPLSLVQWPVHNSDRLDLIWTEEPNRSGGTDYRPPVLPWDEGTLLLWNADPFEPNGGSGLDEQAPTPYLLPYWMARYFGLLSDAQ